MDHILNQKIYKYIINEIDPRLKKMNITYNDIAPWNYLICSLIILEYIGIITRHQNRQWLDKLFSEDSVNELKSKC